MIGNVEGTFQPNSSGLILPSAFHSIRICRYVFLKFEDGSTQKFDGHSGHERTFSGTDDNRHKKISGVWIKCGCNGTDDCTGCGEFVGNPNLQSQDSDRD